MQFLFVCCKDMSFTLVIQHGGSFEKDKILEYKKQDVDPYKKMQDIDTQSYFEGLELLKELGYNCSNYRLWWKQKDASFEEGINEFSNDNDTLELCNYALTNEFSNDNDLPFNTKELIVALEVESEIDGWAEDIF